MDKIIKLVVFLVVLYVAYSVGLPWIQGLLDDSPLGPGSNASEEALCASAAERTVDGFGDRLRQFSSPPIDVDDWSEMVSKTQDEIYEAERGCRCDHPACRKAAQALSKLDNMVTDFDNSVQGGRGVPANGARRFESIYDSVNQARSLTR